MLEAAILTCAKVSEVYKFCQDDLQSDDVMMLDAGDSVYVWEGRHRDDKEIKMALETALVRPHSSA